MIVACLVAACGTLPVAVSRDATVRPAGTSEVHVTTSIPVAFGDDMDEKVEPSKRVILGGLGTDIAYHDGVGDGKENTYLGGFNYFGAYAGYERATELRQGAVGFYGVSGGVHLHAKETYPFLQPHAGVVVGSVTGWFRPEIALRASVQGGIVSRDQNRNVYYAYALGLGTIEPRLRISLDAVSIVGGVTLGYGLAQCQECIASSRVDHMFVVGPFVGIGVR